jgi:hypothetical protein
MSTTTSATAIDKASGGIIIIGGVFVIAVVAGFSNGLGKVLFVLMLGYLLLWFITGSGTQTIAGWVSKLPAAGQGVVIA